MFKIYEKDYKCLRFLESKADELLKFYLDTKPEEFEILAGWNVVTQYQYNSDTLIGINEIFDEAIEISKEDGVFIAILSYSTIPVGNKTVFHTHTHTHPLFKRLHLNLQTNDDSYLEIYQNQIPWITGKTMVFENPNYVHRPVNNGITDRINVIIDLYECKSVPDDEFNTYLNEIVGTKKEELEKRGLI